jgi:hypothetical protein
VQANTYEMDTANHTDETKWLLPVNMVDKPHQPKYSQVSTYLARYVGYGTSATAPDRPYQIAVKFSVADMFISYPRSEFFPSRIPGQKSSGLQIRIRIKEFKHF